MGAVVVSLVSVKLDVVSVARSIGSLNTAPTLAFRGTPMARSVGDVVTTRGAPEGDDPSFSVTPPSLVVPGPVEQPPATSPTQTERASRALAKLENVVIRCLFTGPDGARADLA